MARASKLNLLFLGPINLHFSPSQHFCESVVMLGPSIRPSRVKSMPHKKRTYLSHAASNSSIFVRPSFFSSKGGLTMDLGCGGKWNDAGRPSWCPRPRMSIGYFSRTWGKRPQQAWPTVTSFLFSFTAFLWLTQTIGSSKKCSCGVSNSTLL